MAPPGDGGEAARAAPVKKGEMEERNAGRVLSLHLGHSANCSSVGSVVDVLFVSSVAATAILAALVVLLSDAKKQEAPEPPPEKESDADPG